MTCDPFLNKKTGELVGFACGHKWGIGIYYHCHQEDCFCEGEGIYGFPSESTDPDDFIPDFESCSPEEIAAWEQARTARHA